MSQSKGMRPSIPLSRRLKVLNLRGIQSIQEHSQVIGLRWETWVGPISSSSTRMIIYPRSAWQSHHDALDKIGYSFAHHKALLEGKPSRYDWMANAVLTPEAPAITTP